MLGKLRPEVGQEVGLADTQVIAPACHDTGSAVAGIPFPHEGLAFISSGTWSLVGTVLLEPVVSGGGQGKTFTNEGGVAGSIRFLQNVIGLWLLQECLREWNGQGLHLTAADLAATVFGDSPRGAVLPRGFDHLSCSRQHGGTHQRRVARRGLPGGETAAGIGRDHLPQSRPPLRGGGGRTGKLSGKSIKRICIVGGGVKNEALNRLTELVTGIEVVRGPSESTAAGNIAVQIAALEKAVSLDQIQAISAKLKFGSPT